MTLYIFVVFAYMAKKTLINLLYSLHTVIRVSTQHLYDLGFADNEDTKDITTGNVKTPFNIRSPYP